LQKAREDLHRSQEDVASSLRLQVRTVQALEEDRYEGLPPTYIRGYLRNYAKLLGLDPDQIVASLQEQRSELPSIVTTYNIGPTQQFRSRDRPVKIVTYLVTSVLAVLAFTWWLSRQADLESPPSVFDPETAVLIPPKSGSSAPAAETRTDSVAQAETAATEKILDPEPATAMLPQQVAPQDRPAEADVAPLSVPVDPAPTAAPAVTDSTAPGIVLQVANDSWAEVTDATGKRLYYNLAKRGETVKLAGAAPYRVIIGNAPSVTMHYDGKPIDVISVARNGVAKFRIGAEGIQR
jgi:cytoskeleton protein RodZ